MRTNTRFRAGRAFTMIELLVVISIIAVLVAILIPAVNAVRTQAKIAQTAAAFNGLTTGLEAFRGESALGGRFPPSASDDPDDRQMIANPLTLGDDANMKVAGAHLLVQAMLGADLLGTPGFVDVDRDGYWANDTSRSAAYELDLTTTEPLRARYGGAGYVDENMRSHVKSLRQLQETGTIVSWTAGQSSSTLDTTGRQMLFVDPWDHPILYYRANPAARRMTGEGSGDGDAPGIYRQEDNGIITGSNHSSHISVGMDFGAGRNARGRLFHNLAVAVYPPAVPTFSGTVNTVLTEPTYDDSLARFVLDAKVRGRNSTVRKDSYLLISAGPDARYGTEDDVTNWKRSKE